MNPPAKTYKNRVLAALPKAEIERLRPHLSPVTLKLRTQLLDGRADYAYFLEEGLASVVLTLANGATVEVGVIGIDGVVGLPVLLGAKTMPGETFIQVQGSGYRMDAKRLRSEFEREGQLRSHLQKYLLGIEFTGHNLARICALLPPSSDRQVWGWHIPSGRTNRWTRSGHLRWSDGRKEA